MKILHPTALRHAADYGRAQLHLDVGPDTSIEDVLVPGYWRHHAAKLNVNDLIDILGQGFDITVRVVEKGNGFVNMRVLRKWEDDAIKAVETDHDDEIPAGYVIDHTPRTRWRVRLKDGAAEIARDCMTKPDAIAKALEHAVKSGTIAA